jgi:hypothetical protein
VSRPGDGDVKETAFFFDGVHELVTIWDLAEIGKSLALPELVNPVVDSFFQRFSLHSAFYVGCRL